MNTKKLYTWEEVQQYASERVKEETASLENKIRDMESKMTNICSYVNEMAYSKLKIEEHHVHTGSRRNDELEDDGA